MRIFIVARYIIFNLWFLIGLTQQAYAQNELNKNAIDINQANLLGKKVIDDLLNRKQFMLYESELFTGIHYAEVVAGFAAMEFAHRTNDADRLSQLRERFSRVSETDIQGLFEADHVDSNVFGAVPLQEYLILGDKTSLDTGIMLAEGQWQQPLDNGMSQQTRYWIDDIYMVNILQVQAYRATGNAKYLQRAALQTANYLAKLQQANGLFFHGEKAPFYWGRGNGWVAAGLAVILSELPSSNEHYEVITQGYLKMMQALLAFQSDDGMWRQLVDKTESWKETSATAMFAYAMLVGVKQGLLDNAIYKQSYTTAWLALQHYINDKGQLSNVCVGTGQSLDINYYLQRPTITGDLHGQAPLLWFINELTKNKEI